MAQPAIPPAKREGQQLVAQSASASASASSAKRTVLAVEGRLPARLG